MDRVVLDDEAKLVLMRYKWPGNVRQLKNITEQISILSPKRDITADIMRQFIPEDIESTQLTTIGSQKESEHSFESEREILYKILFDLRNNVKELRQELDIVKKKLNMQTDMPATINKELPALPAEDAEAEEYFEPQYVTTKADNNPKQSLNIEKMSKEYLERALERNNGNRKKAADELGISDRTLYRWLRQFGIAVIAMLVMITSFSACQVSYKFNGASIDYTKTKTIQIADFPIRASYVWGPMASIFNNQLKDQFANHTKLIQVKRNGDLKIEGEIIRYDQRNKSVSSEGYSSQTELSMTVNVRFTNNTNHTEDFEQQFTATSTYENTQTLNSVQEELVTQMVKEITDQIFNATVANW